MLQQLLGEAPLHYLDFLRLVHKGNVPVVKMAMKRLPTPFANHEHAAHGLTAVMVAAHDGLPFMLELLLQSAAARCLSVD
jgi:hypothetical protein